MIQCLLGSSQTFDACAYVRNKIEDTSASFVPDGAMTTYVEAAAEEFSRLWPLGEIVLGNIGANPPTSPLVTVANQSRYVCNSANGFTPAAMDIIDVLYRASGVFTAASEIAYLALMPVSPLNWFRIDKDLLNSPSSRHIRDQYLQELDHYGIGYWRTAVDAATGLPAIDVYPPPTTAGLPIFVRYNAQHSDTNNGVATNTFKYLTVPEDKKRFFGQLLYAEVLQEECDRLFRIMNAKAGITQVWSSPADIRAYAESIKQQVFIASGGGGTVVGVST